MNEQAAAIRYMERHVARMDFWWFCKVLAPDFYTDEREHLHTLCVTLQALYEGRIIKYKLEDEWQIVEHKKPAPWICKKLMINVPPQHGKTRTLIMFAAWMFGINPDEKVITCSYNDTTATDFSKYTRDLIAHEKNEQEEQAYCDIFPKTQIKRGTATYKKWALEGKHFSYLGAGVEGAVTSKGGSVLIVDDPVKGAAEALNDEHLERIWLWYNGTFRSRVSAKDGEPLEIVNMTRWSINDPCGKILSNKRVMHEWHVVKMEVRDKKTGKMLCPSLFSERRYIDMRDTAKTNKFLKQIFEANYHQEPFEASGLLFDKEVMNFYKPSATLTRMFETSVSYIDVADEGDDSLAQANAKNIGPRIYIPTLVHTKDDTDTTLPLCAATLRKDKVEYCRVESNNQGSVFYKQLRKMYKLCEIFGFFNSDHKHTRIIMNAWFVERYFWFLEEEYWDEQYRSFMEEVFAYRREIANKAKDDAPDCLTGLAVFIRETFPDFYEDDEEIEDGEEEEEDNNDY